MKVIAIFGGAFDPVHFGHLKPALELCACPQIKEVRLIPCGFHPYAKNMTPAAHRIHMLKIVCRPPCLFVDDCACNDDRLLYTVDLLEFVRTRCGSDVPLALVVGDDAYSDMENWKKFHKISQLAHIIVLRRTLGGVSDQSTALPDAMTETSGGLTCHFANTVTDVSSTQVRKLLEAGKAPRGLIPGSVWNYIRRHRLYGVS